MLNKQNKDAGKAKLHEKQQWQSPKMTNITTLSISFNK